MSTLTLLDLAKTAHTRLWNAWIDGRLDADPAATLQQLDAIGVVLNQLNQLEQQK